MEYCCHAWADAPSCYLEFLDKLKNWICRTVGPFFCWDSLYARLNSHYEAWSYKKKKHKKIKAYRKSVWKECKVKRFLLILDYEAWSDKKKKHKKIKAYRNLFRKNLQSKDFC